MVDDMKQFFSFTEDWMWGVKHKGLGIEEYEWIVL